MQHIGYTIYERIIDKTDPEDIYYFWNRRVRTYTPHGKLISERRIPDDAETWFTGRDEREMAFHIGDIVEIRWDTYSVLGIVTATPMTKNEFKVARCYDGEPYLAKKQRHAPPTLTAENDRYNVAVPDKDKPLLVDSYNVFPPADPVSKDLEKQLKKKLSRLKGEEKL